MDDHRERDVPNSPSADWLQSADTGSTTADSRVQLKNRISFKLARIGVIVAFTLGLVFSSVQVYLDFSNQGKELDAQIHRILTVVVRPAARSVHLLDEDLADEVVQGLMEYDFVREASIVDDLGVALAKNSRPVKQSKTRWITRSIKSEELTYAVTLETPGVRDLAPGKLIVMVDVDAALAGFFDRSLYVFATGMVRNMILVVLFFLVFYMILTKPLLGLVEAFRNINPEDPGKTRFKLSSSHDGDELALLARTGNDYLDANARHIAQRDEAQGKLKDVNIGLELRVIDRTAELTREVSIRANAEKALQELNTELEQRVEDRTTELKAAKEMAELASRSKSQFLANMSHELRTPLNAIIGFSKIMKDQMFGPVGVDKYLEYSGDILSSSTHLLKVIGDILDVSKIEAGEMDLEITEIDLVDVAEVCKSLLNEPIQMHNLTLDISVSADFPKIYADERRLKQIIINLFSNSVKFTPDNGSIRFESHINEDGSLTLKVSDTGIGIAEKDLATVMDPFSQVSDILTRKHEGTGLGLSLCKSLVNLHDGNLSIESESDQGTVVSIWLPASRVVPPPPDKTIP